MTSRRPTKKAKKALDSLNSFIDRCIKRIRPAMREVIAKEIGGKAKADDLMTFGSIDFEKFEIRIGAFTHEKADKSKSEGGLDLSKALKKKKWQYFGVAWKADKCVVSVKSKKPFKEGDLKELRESLPEGLSKGAKMSSGKFKADSATNVRFAFPEKEDKPSEILLRDAMKEQTGQAVHVVCSVGLPDEKGDGREDEDEKDGKETNEGKQKGAVKGAATKTATKTAGKPKSSATTGNTKGGSPKTAKSSSPQGKSTPQTTKGSPSQRQVT